MVVARSYHAAILLADGNVLILGGYSAGTASIEQGAEIFDVGTETFAKIGSTRAPRVQPTVTLRGDGVVVVVGGDAAGSKEYYDPIARAFGDDPAAPTVTTDKADYAPGELVTFTGAGWAPGEVVEILLREEPDIHGDLTLFAVSDQQGNITNTDFSPEAHHIGVTFYVTATGATSNLTATATFTDAAPPSSTYSISSSTGVVLAGGSDIGNHCDDCSTVLTPPFPITFYDSVFSTIRVSSNGNIQFGTAAFENPNFCLPSTIFPGGALMPYWDDLRTDLPAGSGKGIFTQTTGAAPNRQFHIRWNTAYFQDPAPQWFGLAEFEVVFFEGIAKIDYVYGNNTGNSATIGVQRTSTGPSTQFACNIGSVTSGTALTLSGVPITTATTTTLVSSPNPSGLGQNAAFTATVKWGINAVTIGTVTLNDGPTTVASSSAFNTAGQVVFNISNLAVGSHMMTANYSGSGGLQPSSGAVTHVANKGNTTTTVASDANPSVIGQTVTLTATVNPIAPASGTRTGTVQFKDGGTDIGPPVALSSGTAVLATSFVSTGAHTITAVYSGDANFSGSTSAGFSQTVNKSNTMTGVVSDANPSAFGQAVTFTATVSAASPGGGIPGGSVQFKDDGADLGAAVILIGGTASTSASTLTTGLHSITAVYGGNSSFNGSSSNVLSQTVNKASATLALTGLIHTYDGSAKSATVTTSPVGLSGVSVTYDGSPTAPSNAGSYAVVASLTNANYDAPNATSTLVISKASATLALSALTHTYDGSPKAATVTTSPVGLSGVSVTYDGSPTAPSNAGSYAVVASLTNANYDAPNATGTLVISKASATLTLTNLTHTYNGSPKSATVTTSPVGLSGVSVTYDGSPTAPSNAGSYAVVAVLTNANYDASDSTGTLTIAKANQTTAFGPLGNRTFGDSDSAVAASSSSGLAVTFSALPGSCTITVSSVHLTGAGSCTIRASQGGDANYNAAADVDRSFTIGKASQAITVTAIVPASAIYNTSFNTAATGGGSGTAVVISPSGVCSGGGSGTASILMTSGTGTCSVTYSQAGDANYYAAPQLQATTTAQRAAQTIGVTTGAPSMAGFGTSFTVAGTGGASGNPITYTSPSGDGCSDVGPTFNVISTTACQVLYNQAGNANYTAAVQVTQTVNVSGYLFDGFFQPIDMPTGATTVWNSATAGQAIPIKWKLTLNGAPVSTLASYVGMYSAEVACGTGAGNLEDAIEEYAPGASNITYDGNGNFHINWKTLTTYKGKCRAFYVSFNDGSTSKVAYFKFK